MSISEQKAEAEVQNAPREHELGLVVEDSAKKFGTSNSGQRLAIYRLGRRMNEAMWHLEQAALDIEPMHRWRLVEVCESIEADIIRIAPPSLPWEDYLRRLPGYLRAAMENRYLDRCPLYGKTLTPQDLQLSIRAFLSRWRQPGMDEVAAEELYAIRCDLEENGLLNGEQLLESHMNAVRIHFFEFVFYPVRLLAATNSRDQTLFDLGVCLDEGVRPRDVWRHSVFEIVQAVFYEECNGDSEKSKGAAEWKEIIQEKKTKMSEFSASWRGAAPSKNARWDASRKWRGHSNLKSSECQKSWHIWTCSGSRRLRILRSGTGM